MTRREQWVFQPVLVMKMLSSLVPCTRLLTYSRLRTSLKNHRFDIIVVDAKKPNFFKNNAPFVGKHARAGYRWLLLTVVVVMMMMDNDDGSGGGDDDNDDDVCACMCVCVCVCVRVRVCERERVGGWVLCVCCVWINLRG